MKKNCLGGVLFARANVWLTFSTSWTDDNVSPYSQKVIILPALRWSSQFQISDICSAGINILGKVFPAQAAYKKKSKISRHERRLSHKGGSWPCLHVVVLLLRNVALYLRSSARDSQANVNRRGFIRFISMWIFLWRGNLDKLNLRVLVYIHILLLDIYIQHREMTPICRWPKRFNIPAVSMSTRTSGLRSFSQITATWTDLSQWYIGCHNITQLTCTDLPFHVSPMLNELVPQGWWTEETHQQFRSENNSTKMVDFS